MRSKKINAFTLMEVTVAMLLSAICITICYTAYSLIGDYYTTFRKKNESTDAVLSLRHVMEKDFMNSRYILRTENGLELRSDSAKIRYQFNDQAVVRNLNELRADSFKVAPKELACYFEKQEVLETDTVDEVRFSISLNQDVKVPIQINKEYSAYDLFK